MWSEKSHRQAARDESQLGPLAAGCFSSSCQRNVASSFTGPSQALPHPSGVLLLAHTMKPTPAPRGRNRASLEELPSQDLQGGQEGSWANGRVASPLPPSPCVLPVLTNNSRAGKAIHRSHRCQASCVVGCGCQGKHAALHSDREANGFAALFRLEHRPTCHKRRPTVARPMEIHATHLSLHLG